MKKYFVIGNPIEHSLSPKLHNYWINENKIRATYEKKQTTESDLKRIIDEIKIRPGFNVKAAINFEFGTKKSATALEVGFLADFFIKEIIIMPTAENYNIYPTAFITLFYGRKY